MGPDGHVLVVDRSAAGIAQIERTAATEIAHGVLSVRHCAVEDIGLLPGEEPSDLAFACRVGVLDGRHPQGYAGAVENLRSMLVAPARILIEPH